MQDPAVQALLTHRITRSLAARLALTIPELTRACFLPLEPYTAVVFKPHDGDDRPTGTSTTLLASHLQLLLYSYIINRAAAAQELEAQSYVLVRIEEIKPDESFIALINALLLTQSNPAILPEQDLGLTYTAADGKQVLEFHTQHLSNAFRILWGKPLKLSVQRQVPKAGTGRVEKAVFRFWERREGGWETEWEVMSTALAWCEVPDEEYGLEWRAVV